LAEATLYLQHELLGKRLLEMCRALLDLDTDDAYQIFGDPDDLKLCSSMTLFAQVKNTLPVFKSVLDKFFGGKADEKTVRLLQQPASSL
jgi:uncharacterized protein (DUF1810 family)